MLPRALSLLLLAGCVREDPLPFVGECAEYPNGNFAHGQIGIGTCLSGPTSLRFAGEDEAPVLLIGNANPYLTFDGGSVLAIPWSGVDLLDDRNLIHTLDPVAVGLPSFASPLAIQEDEDLGFIGVRESEGARTRVHDDSVWLFDLSDPANPVLSDRGTDGGSQVEVMSDPVDVAIDEETGLAFVANRTSHTISVLDTKGNTVKVIQPWPEHVVTAAVFTDQDDSGATASLLDFQILSPELLPNDSWTMTWVDGSYRLWMPGIWGLWRATNFGDDTYAKSSLGIEMDLDDAPEDVVEITDPHYMASAPAFMIYGSSGDLRAALAGEYVGDWRHQSVPLLSGRSSNWDAHLGGPAIAITEDSTVLFYDGASGDLGATETSSISAATSEDGGPFERIQSTPLLLAQHAHEGDHIADPHLVFDAEVQRWRMYYSAFDGTQWTVGHATSTDLVSWVQDDTPIFTPADGSEAAAPVVHAAPGAWRMWYSRWNGRRWSIGAATSPDGTHWTDLGRVIAFHPDVNQHAFPPGPALQGSETAGFQVRGDNSDLLGVPLIPGEPYLAEYSGWAAVVVAGHHMNAGDAGPDSVGGIRVDSLELDDDGIGRAWLTLTSRGGHTRIGMADVEGEDLSAKWGATFEGSQSGFDRGGVSSPVVFQDGSTWRMLYAGFRKGESTIGMATSDDGETWTSQGQVLDTAGDWESVSLVPNSVTTLADGSFRLWYSGSDGARWRIGSARSEDGQSWTREPGLRGYVFAPGAPGEWDDSGVRDAWVHTTDDGDHLWYAGSDGDIWQVGHAFKAKGETEWVRFTDPETELARPVLATMGGLFHPDGVRRPVVHPTESGFDVWFAGRMSSVNRVGRAAGVQATALHKTPRRPSVGDTLQFETRHGDADQWAIPLDTLVDDRAADGTGLTSLSIDSERGMLYAVSKLRGYVYVIDIRNDSDVAGTGFRDLNYLGVEALLVAETSSQATGFRQVLPVPGADRLIAVCDAPETLAILDLSDLVDDSAADVIEGVAVGWLPAPRGDERDKGADNRSSVGPAQIVLHPDGKRLFASHFNRNSIATYDLTLGPYGTQIRETPLVGENPYSLVLSPDERFLVFGNYTGDVDGDVTSSTVGVLDVDADSPTYLEVRTWIAND